MQHPSFRATSWQTPGLVSPLHNGDNNSDGPDRRDEAAAVDRAWADMEALLDDIKRSQTANLAALAEEHRTLLAICEAYNLVCDAADPGAKIALQGPEAFLPQVTTADDLILRAAAQGTIMSDAELHAALLDIDDAAQFAAQLRPGGPFPLVLPLLCHWLATPAQAGKAFALLHEGVRAFGGTAEPGQGSNEASILARRDLRCDWRSVAAALRNLEESHGLTAAAQIDPANVRALIAHVRQGASLLGG